MTKKSYTSQLILAGLLLLLTFTSFYYVKYIKHPKDIKPGSAALIGDANGDGRVDILDFQLLSNSFGKSSGQAGYDSRTDFNGDGRIDILDFQLLSNNFGRTVTITPTRTVTVTPTRTPTGGPTATRGPTPTQGPISGVTCGSLNGIEKRFPCSTLVAGPMPETASTSNMWSMFTNTLYSGTSNGVNERFSAVANPSGSGAVVRNQNKLSDSEKHTTVGTSRDLPLGSTECSAFRWLWKDTSEFNPIGWSLIWQLQMSGSPIVAVSVNEANKTWFFKSRNGSDSGIDHTLGPVQYGHWAYFVVCTHLADAPNGWTKMWYRPDSWPDVNAAPSYQRSGHDTWQGTTGHNTIGIYAEHSSSTASYYGYFDRYGRATTPQRAVQLAGNQ